MKRNIGLFVLIGLALSFIPSIVLGFDFSWTSPDQDKSLFYLGQIFGPVGSALPHGSGNALIGNIFTIFNIAVLTLGSIVVSYTIILSTINTAQEGEAMGRKWSSLWIPLRSAVGMAFLIPTASGYSILQMLMMEVVVYGVAAANQIWTEVVNAFSQTGGTGLTGMVQMDNGSLQQTATSLLQTAVCTYVVNNDPTCRESMNNATVSAYQKSGVGNELYFGVQGNPSYDQLCGTITAGSAPGIAQDVDSWNATNLQAFSFAYNSVSSAAAEIGQGQIPSSTNVIFTTMNALQGQISTAPQSAPTLSGANADAKNNGWIFAGSYYFVLISNGNGSPKYNAPSATGGPATSQTSSLSSACLGKINTALGYTASYLAQSEVATQGSANNTGTLSLPNVSTDSNVAQFLDVITGPLQSAVESFMANLTTNDPRGPVASLANVGSDLLSLAEDIWFGMMVATLVALLIACIMSGTQPLCYAVGSIVTVLIPILMAIVMIMWAIGGMIGIYLPLVPYLVFTFTALGWMLLVIETIVAAPIVALGLVSPAGEHLGKAAPAVLLICNVFLRPSLMVIGFATASKLVDAMISMLNYGFFATVNSSVHGLGVFGLIALVALYGGLAITIIHECFSLIYVLPDKIMRWIGGQAEQSQVKQQLAEAKKAVEKGHEMGGQMMQGSAEAVHGLAKKAMGKGKKKKGEGEG